MKQFAVHLSDFAALPEVHPLRWLLQPFLTEQTVFVKKSQWDSVGVVVNDAVPDRDWAATMQVALSADMPCGWPIRIYEKQDGRWARLRPMDKAKSPIFPSAYEATND